MIQTSSPADNQGELGGNNVGLFLSLAETGGKGEKLFHKGGKGGKLCHFRPKVSQVFETGPWSSEMQATADAVRVALAAAVPLTHLLPTAELSLANDASDSHIGGVLQQKEAGGWRLLGFFSRKL